MSDDDMDSAGIWLRRLGYKHGLDECILQRSLARELSYARERGAEEERRACQALIEARWEPLDDEVDA